jgi:hypothetical protein
MKLNVKTSSRRLKPDYCQTHQHKADRLTPAKRKLCHRRHHSFVCISCHQSCHRQNLIAISFCIAQTAHSYSQVWRTMAIIIGVASLRVVFKLWSSSDVSFYISLLLTLSHVQIFSSPLCSETLSPMPFPLGKRPGFTRIPNYSSIVK